MTEVKSQEMTGRERVLCALNGSQPDRVPFTDWIYSQHIFAETVGRAPRYYNARDVVECSFALGMDAVQVEFGGTATYSPRFIEEDIYLDEWGTTFKWEPSISWPLGFPIDYPIKGREDLNSYRPPDPTLPGRLDEVQEAIALCKGQLAVLGWVSGPLTTAMFLMGLERTFLSLYDDPDLLTAVFAMSNEYWIEAGLRMLEAGVDAIGIGEDLGSSAGPFFSLSHYRRYLGPYFAELVQAFSKEGVPIILHCDGNISIFLDDLVEAGINALNPLQRTAGMDLAEVKSQYGDRLCLVGNIDASVTLPNSTEKEVEQEVIEAIRIAGPGGGYILSSDHSLHCGIPMRNIHAMIAAVKKHGEYPLRLPDRK